MPTLCTDMNKAVRIRGYLSRANVVHEQSRLGNIGFEHGDFGFRQACKHYGSPQNKRSVAMFTAFVRH
jgi:hypothetical protein